MVHKAVPVNLVFRPFSVPLAPPGVETVRTERAVRVSNRQLYSGGYLSLKMGTGTVSARVQSNSRGLAPVSNGSVDMPPYQKDVTTS